MPKQPAGITKSVRIDALRKVLERWGRLDKEKINLRVANSLGCDPKKIARALYRDLDELVRNREIIDYHFTRDGIPIDEYDSDTHKNTYSEWALIGNENQIIGNSKLDKTGALFYAASRLTRDFKIDDGFSPPDFRTLHIFFNLQQDFYCLKLNLEAIPATLVVGRITEDSEKTFPLKELELKFGKRASFLLLPIPSVTATKDSKHPGHFSITIEKEGHVKVTDLGSTNGTACFKLTMKDAEYFRKSGNVIGNNTVTTSWSSLKAGAFTPVELGKDQAETFALPLLIQASNRFRMMLV